MNAITPQMRRRIWGAWQRWAGMFLLLVVFAGGAYGGWQAAIWYTDRQVLNIVQESNARVQRVQDQYRDQRIAMNERLERLAQQTSLQQNQISQQQRQLETLASKTEQASTRASEASEKAAEASEKAAVVTQQASDIMEKASHQSGSAP